MGDRIETISVLIPDRSGKSRFTGNSIIVRKINTKRTKGKKADKERITITSGSARRPLQLRMKLRAAKKAETDHVAGIS
jgi:hypothetical protein